MKERNQNNTQFLSFVIFTSLGLGALPGIVDIFGVKNTAQALGYQYLLLIVAAIVFVSFTRLMLDQFPLKLSNVDIVMGIISTMIVVVFILYVLYQRNYMGIEFDYPFISWFIITVAIVSPFLLWGLVLFRKIPARAIYLGIIYIGIFTQIIELALLSSAIALPI